MAIKPLGKTLIFIFKDKVNSKGEFVRPPTASGIELVGGFDDSAKQSRWGVVVAAGPDVKNIQPGQEILLPALRWTNGVMVGDTRFWKSDETQVVAVRSKPESELKVLGNYVVFTPLPKKSIKSDIIIVPTKDAEALAEGTIYKTGSEAAAELENDFTIYYNDTNFSEFLTHGGKGYGFIRDSELIAYAPNE